MNPPSFRLNLSGGHVYLVRSSAAQLWWEIQDYKNLNIVHRPSYQELQSRTSYSDFFIEDLKVFVILPRSPEDIVGLRPTADATIVIWLGELDKKTSRWAKTYKKLSGGIYQQVDLTRHSYRHDPAIQEALMAKDIDGQDQIDLCRSLDKNPMQLLFQLRQENPLDYELEEGFSAVDMQRVISSLGTYSGIKVWANMPQGILRGVLINRDASAGGFSIATEKKSYLPDTLKLYLGVFGNSASKYYPHKPHYTTQMFAAWVYLCNTVWRSEQAKGFYSYTSRNGVSGTNFEPGPEALEFLNKYVLNKLLPLPEFP